MADVTAEKLLVAMKRVHDDAISVDGLRRLSGGASQESWAFALTTDAGGAATAERFVLRRSPHSAATVASQAATAGDAPTSMALSLSTEAELIRQAASAGVAVPAVVVELIEDDDLGLGFVMGHVDGETIPQKVLRDPELADARDRLAGQCGEALAGIHAISTEALPELRVIDGAATIAHLGDQFEGFGHPSPVFAAALRWLADQAQPVQEPVLVHGDFRHGNLMIDSNGLAAVLDWELAHLGDPMEDLGWLCAPSWRFGKMDRAVGGFGDRPQLFAAYEAATGVTVDPEQVRFWEAVSALKWGLMCLLMYTAFETGLDPSVERAAIGRRVSETEIDLVDMMFGLEAKESAVPTGDATEGGDGPKVASAILATSPTAGELLQAVESFLRDEAMPGLEGRSGFMARVAANVVATVGREVRFGPQARRVELTRINLLLGEEPVADPSAEEVVTGRERLCAAITDGAIGIDNPELIAHLQATVMDSLAIDQPRYGTYAALAPSRE